MTGKYQTKIVTLDGNNNYIYVNATSKNKLKSLFSLRVHKNSDEIFKFTNFEVANLTARRLLDISTKSYEFIFHIGNLEFSINDTQKVGQHYQYYDNEKMIKYYIKDIKVHRLTKAGYICFEHGDEKFCEKEYGFKRQPELLSWIMDVVDRNIASDKAVGILSKEKISNKEYVLKVKDSTSRIHILTNSKLMDWNQDRKEKQMMCLPYKRNMDKFTTFAVFVAKDSQERLWFNSDKRVEEIIKDIITELRNDVPGTMIDEINPCWVETDFRGYVKINENKIH